MLRTKDNIRAARFGIKGKQLPGSRITVLKTLGPAGFLPGAVNIIAALFHAHRLKVSLIEMPRKRTPFSTSRPSPWRTIGLFARTSFQNGVAPWKSNRSLPGRVG